MGWTIPVWAPIQLVDLAAQHTRSEIDQAFVAAYRSKRSARFRELGAQLLGTSSLKQWHPLLDECLWAHRKARFLIVVPTLLSIADGATARLAGHLHLQSSPRTAAATRVSQLPPGHDRLIWVSLKAFLGRIFARHDFGAEPPSALNRHWLMHGRAMADWGEPDSFRLFQALHTMTLLDR